MVKMKNKVGGGGSGVGVGWGGVGWAVRIEVIVRMNKKSGWPSQVEGGQGGCERRIEVIVKKKIYSSFFIS